MPDTKFSWRGLREHLRRYLWVYLAGIALCLLGNSLLWTVTQPRFSSAETVAIYLADSYSNPEALADIAADALARTQASDPTLKQVSFESMLFDGDDYTSRMLMITRLAVGECDAFMASQAAMDALSTSDALLPLDDCVAAGWLSDYGLEPWYATVTDEETGQTETFLAGLKLDTVNALMERGAFDNAGAYLCVCVNGGNVETTMKVLEVVMQDLTEANHAATEAE